MKNFNQLALISVSTIAMLAVPIAVQAQSNDDEIVTTAQRREQSVAEVPVAVSVLTPEILNDLQIKDSIGLVDAIPNLQGGNNTALGTANMYFLRGQGQDESFATFDPAVGTYIDEVFISRQNANNFNFFDVERLEVLRGPQGTLFGKNTSGGAVNITLRKPGEEMGGFVEAGYGRFDQFKVRGAVDIPMGENIRAAVNAFHISDDGWLKNTRSGEDLNGKDAFGVRAALSVDINESITWDVSADYIDDSQTNITGDLQSNGDVTTISELSDNGLAGITAFPGIAAGAPNQKADYGNETEAFNITSNITAEMESGSLSLILGHRQLDQEFLVNFPIPAFSPASDDPFVIDNIGQHDQFSAELKWIGTYLDDTLDLTAGLFYLDEDNVTDVAGYFFALNRDRIVTNTAQSIAGYLQGDFHVSDRLTATVGARYTDQKKKFGLEDNNPSAGGAGGPTGDMTDLTTANLIALGVPTEIHDKILTPRFALQYEVSDNANIYVSATRGFRSGGWNSRENTAVSSTPFGKETIWSYEAGLRMSPSDHVDLFATAFYSDLDDLQINVATAPGNFDIGNTGGMENKGLELEANIRPNEDFLIYGSAGFQDAKYKPDASEFAICPVGGPNPGLGAFDAMCNVAGVKRAPDVTVTAGTKYDFDFGNGFVITPRGNLRIVSKHVTTSRNRGPVDGYTLWNAGVDIEHEDSGVILSLECTNCSDKRYPTATFGFGDEYYNAPGRWEARVRYNFGARK